MPQLSVVVPCFNEQESLDELHDRVSAVCHEAVGADHEIVLVNDGSRDQTWLRMLLLAERDPNAVLVNLSRNHGHQRALSAGLSVCRGRRVLILDADLQDPPELLGAMMARMDDGADVVYGRRIARAGETAFKRVTAALFYRLFRRLVDIEIPLDTGDFRLLNRRTLDLLNRMPEQHRFIRGMVAWVGLRQEALPYHRAARAAGETKYPFSKMLGFALDAITGFSVKPLRLASWLGLAAGVGGLVVIVYAFGSWMAGRAVEGWTSLMVVTLVLGSCQLLVAGLMGEYLGRLYMEAKGRPLFVIERVVRGSDVPGHASHHAPGHAPASRGVEASRVA